MSPSNTEQVPQPFTFDGARAWVQSWAEHDAARQNETAAEAYRNTVAPGWVNSVIRARELNIAEPEKPVPSLRVIVVEAPLVDGRTWPDLARSETERVCETVADVPLPQPPPAGVRVGLPIGPGAYQCLPGDTTPMFAQIQYNGMTLVKDRGIFGVPYYLRV